MDPKGIRLSNRMQTMASLILPKIASTISEQKSDIKKINLTTAENWLIRPELLKIYKEGMQNALETKDLSYPDGFGGIPTLLDSLADMFNKYFKPIVPVQSQHIVCSPGASSCLDSLLFSLCDAGESVLVIAPYWNGFDFHFSLRPNVKIIPVHAKYHSLDSFDHSLVDALEAARNTAPNVRAVVLSNPNNPFARCYPEHVLCEVMEWCAEHSLHYISDELYALSDFSRSARENTHHAQGTPHHGTESPPVEEVPFVSALSIALDPTKTPATSVIWSFSKDLGSSGLRLGVHVSRPALLSITSAVSSASDPTSLLHTALCLLATTQLPTISMVLACYLLNHTAFDSLVALNRLRLWESHTIITTRLDTWGVKYISATNGPFLLVDLGRNSRAMLSSKRRKRKRSRSSETKRSAINDNEEISAFLRDKAGVLVSSCSDYHMGAKNETGHWEGWVRITFAVPVDVLIDALKKVESAMGFADTSEDDHEARVRKSRRID